MCNCTSLLPSPIGRVYRWLATLFRGTKATRPSSSPKFTPSLHEKPSESPLLPLAQSPSPLPWSPQTKYSDICVQLPPSPPPGHSDKWMVIENSDGSHTYSEPNEALLRTSLSNDSYWPSWPSFREGSDSENVTYHDLDVRNYFLICKSLTVLIVHISELMQKKEQGTCARPTYMPWITKTNLHRL